MVFEFAKSNFSETGWEEFLKEVHRNDNTSSEDDINPLYVEKVTIHTHDDSHDIDFSMTSAYTSHLSGYNRF